MGDGCYGVRVAIVATFYQTEPYLQTYLEAVNRLNPEQPVSLVVVHNDISVEEERIWAAWKRAPHVHPYLHRVPRELPAISLNRAVLSDDSEYLAMWSADDLRHPDSILQQVARLRDTRADLCHGPFEVATEYNAKPVYREERLEYASPHPALLDRCVTGPFFVYRRDLHARVGLFDPGLRIVNDYDFAMRVARAGKIVTVPDTLGVFLDKGAGVSTRKDLRPLHELEYDQVRAKHGLPPIFHR